MSFKNLDQVTIFIGIVLTVIASVIAWYSRTDPIHLGICLGLGAFTFGLTLSSIVQYRRDYK